MFIFDFTKILNLMSHLNTDVYKYLIYLQNYLLGDLLKFDELSLAAEKQEQSIAKEKQLKSLAAELEEESEPWKPTTTHYPYSFEFLHGDTVISRSTIPHSQSLFSTIDILGYLTRKGSDYTATKKNFTSFFKNTLAEDSLELDVLVFVYRHGITHSYFPILNTGISYHSSNDLTRLFFKDFRGDLVLNVNYLKAKVISELNQIVNDTARYPLMEKQYKFLISDLEKKDRGLIENLKLKL